MLRHPRNLALASPSGRLSVEGDGWEAATPFLLDVCPMRKSQCTYTADDSTDDMCVPGLAPEFSRIMKQIQQTHNLASDNMASSRTLENLNVLVIGAGFGGLASAIELARRGAKVRVFESAPDMKRQG